MTPSLALRLSLIALLVPLALPLLGWTAQRFNSAVLFGAVFLLGGALGLLALVAVGVAIAALVRARRADEPFGKAIAAIVIGLTALGATGAATFLGLLFSGAGAHGRPFRAGGVARVASLREGSAWTDDLAPTLDDLTTEERASLADAWRRDGLAEHASVAAFAHLALDLIALGAPASLVDDAHVAARDEVDHARRCFSLAAAYAGAPVGPGAFPEARAVAPAVTLGSLVEASLRDGCVDEAASARVLAACARSARDPVVRDVLRAMADDEARHAELAWDVVAWAFVTAPDLVAPVLRVWVDAPSDAPSRLEDIVGDAHGRSLPGAFAQARRAARAASRERVSSLLSPALARAA
jgi:hypothetical protein